MSPDRDRDWSVEWDEDWSDDSDDDSPKGGRHREKGIPQKGRVNEWGDGGRGRQKHAWRRPRHDD